MSGYILSPQADEDIFEVWRYLFERAIRASSCIVLMFRLTSRESSTASDISGAFCEPSRNSGTKVVSVRIKEKLVAKNNI